MRKVDLSIEPQILAYHEQRKAAAYDADALTEPEIAERWWSRHERPRRGCLPQDRAGVGARAARARRRRRGQLVREVIDSDHVPRRPRRDLQPDRDLRRRRPLPRQRRDRLPDALRAPTRSPRTSSRTCTSTTTTAPSPTSSTSPPASTRWSSARARSRPDPRGAARRPGARHHRPGAQPLFQQALRVGKRAHAETDIDRAAPSLVSVALERATEHVGARWPASTWSCRRRRHGEPRRVHGQPVRRRGRRGRQPHRLQRRAPGRAVRRPGGPADIDEAIAAADVLSPAPAPPWCSRWHRSPPPGCTPPTRSRSSTWRCRTTSTRPCRAARHLADQPGPAAAEVHDGDTANDVTAVPHRVRGGQAFLAARARPRASPRPWWPCAPWRPGSSTPRWTGS